MEYYPLTWKAGKEYCTPLISRGPMPRLHSFQPQRLLLVAWLIFWITTVPLFHIHIPDNANWLSPLQGSAHTVFTPDLPGEFSRPSHEDRKGHINHLSQRTVNAPELGIALFKNDRKEQKAKQLSSLWAIYHAPDTLHSCWPFEWSESSRQSLLSHTLPSTRAPPRVVYT